MPKYSFSSRSALPALISARRESRSAQVAMSPHPTGGCHLTRQIPNLLTDAGFVTRASAYSDLSSTSKQAQQALRDAGALLELATSLT